MGGFLALLETAQSLQIALPSLEGREAIVVDAVAHHRSCPGAGDAEHAPTRLAVGVERVRYCRFCAANLLSSGDRVALEKLRRLHALERRLHALGEPQDIAGTMHARRVLCEARDVLAAPHDGRLNEEYARVTELIERLEEGAQHREERARQIAALEATTWLLARHCRRGGLAELFAELGLDKRSGGKLVSSWIRKHKSAMAHDQLLRELTLEAGHRCGPGIGASAIGALDASCAGFCDEAESDDQPVFVVWRDTGYASDLERGVLEAWAKGLVCDAAPSAGPWGHTGPVQHGFGIYPGFAARALAVRPSGDAAGAGRADMWILATEPPNEVEAEVFLALWDPGGSGPLRDPATALEAARELS